MSAEVLRRAASLMRERAEAASPSPWVKTMWPKEIPGVYSQAIEDTHEFDPEIARALDVPDAEHIASWHPAVALAVADWLDNAAEDLDMQAPDGDLRKQWDMRVHINGDKALTVARAYLGEPS